MRALNLLAIGGIAAACAGAPAAAMTHAELDRLQARLDGEPVQLDCRVEEHGEGSVLRMSNHRRTAGDGRILVIKYVADGAAMVQHYTLEQSFAVGGSMPYRIGQRATSCTAYIERAAPRH